MEEVEYLTKNGLKMIISSGKKEIKDDKYIFQVLQVTDYTKDQEATASANSKKNIKMKLKISDGIASVSALVNKDAYEGIKHLDVKENSIICISGFKTANVKSRNILILEKPFEVLGYWNVLGAPKSYEELTQSDFTKRYNLSFKTQQENVSTNIQNNETPKSEKVAKSSEAYEERKASFTDPQPPMQVDTPPKKWNNGFVEILHNEHIAQEYTPISALNPMNPDWIIKARVTKKGAPRTWKNFRGEGMLMNIELKDEFGDQIQGTFFNKHVDKFKDQVQENRVYSFQYGQVKEGNSKYTAIKNPYCITFNGNTKIKPLPDDESIETDGYSYSTLRDISKMDAGLITDVKGVVILVGDMDEIPMKNGKLKPLRRVFIADNSKDQGLSIQITFWGQIAYKANFSIGDVVGLKDAKVGNYNGRSLNMSDECELKKLKEDKILTPWFKSLKSIKDIVSLSEQDKNKFQNKEAGLQPNLINEVELKVHEDIEECTTPNYVVECYLTYIAKMDNMVYMACPEDKKKVHKEFGREDYYWDRCTKYYDKPVPTYMVTAKVSDPSGALFVSFYAEQAEELFDGFSAADFSHIQIHGAEDEVKEKINDFLYKPVRVLIKARQNDFGNEQGIKYFGQKVYQYKYNAHNLSLINKLKDYSKTMK